MSCRIILVLNYIISAAMPTIISPVPSANLLHDHLLVKNPKPECIMPAENNSLEKDKVRIKLHIFLVFLSPQR